MAVAYFNKRMKGYDTNEVDTFIVNLVADSEYKIKELTENARELRIEIKELQDELAARQDEYAAQIADDEAKLNEVNAKYESLCAQIGERLQLADERAAEIIAKANAEAERIVAEARLQGENESKQIIADTRERCAQIEKSAESYAERQRAITEGLEKAKAAIEAGLGEIENNVSTGENNG